MTDKPCPVPQGNGTDRSNAVTFRVGGSRNRFPKEM
ncbi:hypothetical protein FHS36_000366 [Streptomyces eurocidicus]|uniref:Uncharacterized protein n=1 Tax=Streptomyces eurocidicus TaxID=66423 RepID=A0A7W8B862_STREU|nr:hypothetical protein [Streptomyces eurocidicus]